MAETAAHLVDHVIPPVSVRQWVLSLPKRLRWHLHRDPALTTAVLRLFLRAVERTLLTHSETAPASARMGAVSFIHRFGAALNPHTHYHCCVTDGMFSADVSGVRFHTSRAQYSGHPAGPGNGAPADLAPVPTPWPAGYQRVTGRRVYHVNFIIKYSFQDEECYRRIRVVMDRSGIKRLEEVGPPV
jgi:hypothetical protein